MLPYRDSRPTRIILAIFFLIVLGYAYYEARGFLFGPTIGFSSGTSLVVSTPYVLIEGQADRIASLAVDGSPIQVTETGAFQEPYVLSPGENRIIFDAKDKYGHTTEKVVEIVYTPDSTSSPQASATATAPVINASSTPSTATSTATTATDSIEEIQAQEASESVSPAIAPGR